MDVIGTAGDDTLLAGGSGSDSILGLAGNDVLEGEAGNDTLRGGDGDDELLAGAGSDLVDGGAGFDFASWAGEAGGVNASLATGLATTATGTDTLTGIEGLIGTDFADSLSGNAGDNVLVGFEGNNTLAGGDGFDLVHYTWAVGTVTASLALGTASGYWGTDTLIGIEDLTGSASHANVLEGNGWANVLNGGRAADSLTGGAGDDTMDGWLGNDTLDGGAGYDYAVFGGSLNTFVIQLGEADGQLWVWGEGADELRGIEALVVGGSVYHLFEGGDTGEALNGTINTDFIRGRGGNDTIGGDASNDLLFGDAGNDYLDGSGGTDYLDGGTGADTLVGGAGDDVLVVDSAADVIVEAEGGGTDRVVATYSYTLGNFLENLQLAPGTANLDGTGNAGANVLTGNAGRNQLSGLAGNDTLDGGEGIDFALYAGTRAQYTAAFVTGGLQVNGTATGEGTDLLTNVERLRFSDVFVALDLDGNAGIVAKVLGSVFGPAAIANEAYAGVGIFLADGGTSYEALMGLALSVALGPNATNEQVVELLYTNVVGSAPDTATRDSFVDLIEQGWFTQASLGVMAANYMGIPAGAGGGLEYI